MPSQHQMLAGATRDAASRDELFMQFVADGLTAPELARLIAKRPSLWSRYSRWLERLPK